MSTDKPDRLISGLIRRALVPRGFRPQCEDELEKALSALGDIEIPQETVDEIVRSVVSDNPSGCLLLEYDSMELQRTEDLVEMFRAEGEFSEEIAERLRELEKEAENEAEDDEDDSGDVR